MKSSLERLIPQPVIVPEEPEFALARGAALAAANVPGAEASTCGLAYSQDPDELSHSTRPRSNWPTRIHRRPCSTPSEVTMSWARRTTEADPRVRIPIGNVAAATLVIGAVTLAMLVAGNVRARRRQGLHPSRSG